eukprot:3857791-Amphidinium_carterae.2
MPAAKQKEERVDTHHSTRTKAEAKEKGSTAHDHTTSKENGKDHTDHTTTPTANHVQENTQQAKTPHKTTINHNRTKEKDQQKAKEKEQASYAITVDDQDTLLSNVGGNDQQTTSTNRLLSGHYQTTQACTKDNRCLHNHQPQQHGGHKLLAVWTKCNSTRLGHIKQH